MVVTSAAVSLELDWHILTLDTGVGEDEVNNGREGAHLDPGYRRV